MSITIDLPPAMAEEVESYASLEGTSLEKFFLASLSAELKRRREKDAQHSKDLMERWRTTVRKGHGRIPAPYRFNRADAYVPEKAFA